MVAINIADRKLTHEYYVGVMQTCAELIELRSNETGEQCARLERLAERVGRQMKLTTTALRDLVCGAIVHDVGKIGMPDAVLNKPDKLTDEEYLIIQTHVPLGVARLRKLRVTEGVVTIAAQHHEKYDGTGYPNHLRHDGIAMSARIFTVCDAYDAMVSDRCYRKGIGHDAAMKELRDYAGTQFDPKVVKAFSMISLDELRGFDEIAWQ